MKKAIRSSVIMAAASAAIVAGVIPAGATAPVKLKASAVISNAATLKGTVSGLTVGGSTFVQNFAQAALTAYNTPSANSGVFTAAFGGPGSHTGRENVASGVYQIGFSDVPLGFANAAEGSGIAQVPDALSAVGIIYNLGFNNTFSAAAGDFTLANNVYTYTPGSGNNALASAIPSGSTTPVNASVSNTIGVACATALAAHPLNLTGLELGKIYSNNNDVITSWNDASIIASNPKLTVKISIPATAGYSTTTGTGSSAKTKVTAEKNGKASFSCLNDLTKSTITRFSRKDGSGTTFMFTDYLSKVDNADFSAPTQNGFNDSLSTALQNLGDVALTGDGGSGALQSAVVKTDGGITYDEYGYATAAKAATNTSGAANGTVGIANIQSGAASGAKFVALSDKTIADAASEGLAAIENNAFACNNKFSTDYASSTACFSITNVASDKAYPISGFTYALLPEASATNLQVTPNAALSPSNAQQLEALKFVLWFTQTYQATTGNLTGTGFVALPKTIQADDFTKLCGVSNSTSSAFVNGAFSSLCLSGN